MVADLNRKLASGDLQFTQYREFLQSKGAGKPPRVISVPTVRDRIALRAMAEFLSNLFPDVRNSIPQVKIDKVYKALKTGEYDTFIKLDIKDFYPSISHTQVVENLRKKIRRTSILRLFLCAIRTPTVPDRAPRRSPAKRGVPQGLAISNLLAELVVQSVDRKVESVRPCEYVRYVDDVLILCRREDAKALLDEAKAAFSNVELEAHDIGPTGKGKSSHGLIRAGFQYLGYWFKDDKVTVRAESVHRIESSLARAFTRYKKRRDSDFHSHELARCQWRVNLAITGCIYKGQARGWLHYFRQMNDLELIKSLDMSLDRFAKRFNMPSSFRSKSFMKTYWEIRRGRSSSTYSSYIPNYDRMSTDEKRSFLMSIGTIVPNVFEDSEVDRLFDKVIGRQIDELEVDVGEVY
ncbi:reverse transcriptase domain-containing protein [Actinokineospora soli]|uniref:RNA-directed DNA polymerase n=1 Tax=Actinokineospora soli TaxID=1048753 RepID=A0ABW2TPN3_9PSEU